MSPHRWLRPSVCPNLHDPQIQDELCLTTIRQWTGAHSWVLPWGSPVGWSGPVCCGFYHFRAALEATPVANKSNWGREEAKELNTKANTFFFFRINVTFLAAVPSFVLEGSWNVFRVWPALQVMKRLYLGYVELDRKLFSVTVGTSEEKTAS